MLDACVESLYGLLLCNSTASAAHSIAFGDSRGSVGKSRRSCGREQSSRAARL